MKKILSVALVVLMMIVCFVPAFALVSPENPGTEYKVTVYTTSGGTFTYTINEDKIILIAVPHSGHSFTGWKMTGTYRVVEGDESSTRFVIIPDSDIVAVSTYDGRTDVEVNPWDGTDSPKTGDNLVPAVVVACTALLGLGYCVNRLKKEK